jgi:hypothetical protein
MIAFDADILSDLFRGVPECVQRAEAILFPSEFRHPHSRPTQDRRLLPLREIVGEIVNGHGAARW